MIKLNIGILRINKEKMLIIFKVYYTDLFNNNVQTTKDNAIVAELINATFLIKPITFL
jgi:hypothetical protein